MTEFEKKNYYAIHKWLKNNYGKANHCENPNCKHESNRFEWAKIEGKSYDYERNNFHQLCKICHSEYDYKEHSSEWNKKVSKSLNGRKLSNEHKSKVSKPEDWTKERKENISRGIKRFYENGGYIERTEKWKRNISESLKGKISHPEERRKRIGDKMRGISQEKIICPHCGKEGGKPIMKRFHFENCKYKL